MPTYVRPNCNESMKATLGFDVGDQVEFKKEEFPEKRAVSRPWLISKNIVVTSIDWFPEGNSLVDVDITCPKDGTVYHDSYYARRFVKVVVDPKKKIENLLEKIENYKKEIDKIVKLIQDDRNQISELVKQIKGE